MGRVHRFGVRRLFATSGAVLAVTLSGAVLVTAPATALTPAAARSADAGGGTAVISGRLVVPGPATGQGGVTVTLHGVPTSGDVIDRAAVTKADGTFAFRDLAGGDWSYTITAPYQGATFSTDRVTVPAGQGLTLKLPVFTPTESPAKIKTSSWIVWLDVTGDKVAVEQNLSYTNTGATAFVGTVPVADAQQGAKAAALLPIAPGASNFQYLGRFEVCCSAVTNGSWAHTRPLDPGGSSGTLRYESPRPASLAFLAQFPADSITVLAPKGTAVSSPQLTTSGTTTDNNVTYDVYKSGAIKAGDTVTVSLSPAATTSSSTPWWLVAVIMLLLVVAAVVVVVLLRRRRSSASTAAAAKPKVAKAAPVAPARTIPAPKPAKAARATNSAARTPAESLAEQLAQLDVKYENGELSDEAAYRRVRESLVQQLVDAVATDPTSLS
jgi:hypothetical protein